MEFASVLVLDTLYAQKVQPRIRVYLAASGRVASLHPKHGRGANRPGGADTCVPLERVSIVLGHTSIKITEKH
jgi:hypothetical protein